jgi:hypothetical protein
MHVITPKDLKKFQLEHYKNLLENPRSANHKIFLKKQIKQLQNDMDSYPVNNVSHSVSFDAQKKRMR